MRVCVDVEQGVVARGSPACHLLGLSSPVQRSEPADTPRAGGGHAARPLSMGVGGLSRSRDV